ncbi:XrtA/PEP-CTERM system TPR-repeat protein PrsT [Roseateles sp. DB2]|uniref:XrtA/PEP-CTERM system TPR-repeat protein PrsT n=1 Tax=Roseateles sp. DB2 TaxID=3453717 RepID=UPI003EE86095
MLAFSRTILAAALAAALLGACSSKTPEQHLTAAKAMLAKNDGKSAAIELKSALQGDPSMAEARFLLGTTLLAQGDPISARIELEKARELGYPADQLVPPLARVLFIYGEYEKVLSEFSRTQLDVPTAQADLMTTLAESALLLKRKEYAERFIQSALALDAKQPRTLLVAANVAGYNGDYDTALQRVAQVLADEPKNAKAWLAKAEFLRFGLGRDAESVVAYEQALSLDPKSVGANVGLATFRLTKGDLEAARRQVELMRKALPNHPQTRFVAALVALEAGDLKQANEESQAMLKLGPEDARFLHLAGAIAAQSGALLVAEKYLSQSLNQSADNPSARLLLAHTLLKVGEAGKALSALQPLMEQQGRSHAAMALAGQAYLVQGETGKAVDAFRKAVDLDPKDVRSKTALAVVDLEKGRIDEGLGTLKGLAAADTAGYTADLALISALLSRSDSAGALQAIAQLEQKQPKLADAPYLRGSVQLKAKLFPEARASFEQALQLAPSHFQAAVSLAMLDVDSGRIADAIKRFDAMVEKDPRNIRARMASIELRVRAGASAIEYEQLLQVAIKASPDAAEPRLALIRHRVAQGDVKQGLQAAQEGLSAVPDSAEMLLAMGQVQALSGDLNQAVSTLNKLVAKMPNSPDPYLRMAEVHAQAKDLAGAAQDLRRAVALAPRNAEILGKLVAIQVAQGKFSDARTALKDMEVAGAPKSVILAAQGDVAYAQKAWAEAARQFKAALDLQRDDAMLAIKLHSVLQKAGQSAEAARLASSWMAAHPKDAHFLSYLASLALQSGKLSEAESMFNQVLALEPRHSVALNNMAWLLLKAGKSGAVEYAQRAVQVRDDIDEFWDTLAMAQLAAREPARALEASRKAVQLNPGASAARLHMAQALLATGDKSGAKAELGKVDAATLSGDLKGLLSELQRQL